MNELNGHQIDLIMKGAGITKASLPEWIEDSSKAYNGYQIAASVSNIENAVKDIVRRTGNKKFYIVKLANRLDLRIWKV